MGKQLSERGILQENVYNMDETGVLISNLNTVKVLASRVDVQSCRGVGLRRTMITAVECVCLRLSSGLVERCKTHGCLMRPLIGTMRAAIQGT